ncbi:hypothetical protein K438DRAFT_1893208 [Mycena galopus ATCC 62051]|nr:hypothetical protein K438DRAFT_1893208 [Mycena galopus ATCC 62051]
MFAHAISVAPLPRRRRRVVGDPSAQSCLGDVRGRASTLALALALAFVWGAGMPMLGFHSISAFAFFGFCLSFPALFFVFSPFFLCVHLSCTSCPCRPVRLLFLAHSLLPASRFSHGDLLLCLRASFIGFAPRGIFGRRVDASLFLPCPVAKGGGWALHTTHACPGSGARFILFCLSLLPPSLPRLHFSHWTCATALSPRWRAIRVFK